MIVDVLIVQAGENLTLILETPASDEQVRLSFQTFKCYLQVGVTDCVIESQITVSDQQKTVRWLSSKGFLLLQVCGLCFTPLFAFYLP